MRERINLPDSLSQIFTMPCQLPETIRFPSGRKFSINYWKNKKLWTNPLHCAMHIMHERNLKPPPISEQEKSPLVEQLLELIEQQNFIIQQQTEQIQLLKDEIARIKNQPPRPILSPAAWEKRKSAQRDLCVKSVPVPRNDPRPPSLKFTRQNPLSPKIYRLDLNSDPTRILWFKTSSSSPAIRVFVSRFIKHLMASWVTGKLPAYLNGKHFGPTLIRFILYQYYHCHVTQPSYAGAVGRIWHRYFRRATQQSLD
jgi:hypothetical protein